MSLTPLPRAEMDTFLLTVGLAAQLAGEGEPEDGYAALAAGLRWARSVAGEKPWGDALVARWQRVLDHFVDRYGLQRG